MKGRSCPGAAPSLHLVFTFFPTALLFQRPSGRNLSVFRIYRHSLFGRPSGGHIFLCVKKDMEERHASSSQAPHPSFCLSGQKLSRSAAPPLPTKPTYVGLWRGPCPKAALWNLAFIRGFGGETCVVYYEFAVMHFTRFRPVSSSQAPHPSFCLSGQKLSRSAAPPLPTKPTYVGLWRGPLFALLPRTLLYCFNCGEIVGTERITSLICSRKLGGCEGISIFHGSVPQGHFLRRC